MVADQYFEAIDWNLITRRCGQSSTHFSAWVTIILIPNFMSEGK